MHLCKAIEKPSAILKSDAAFVEHVHGLVTKVVEELEESLAINDFAT